MVVRDGSLHLVPFDGFVNRSGRYVAERHTVTYVPSATSFYLLAQQKRRTEDAPRGLLAVGGIPYSGSNLSKLVLARGAGAASLNDLPASVEEVRAARAAVRDRRDTLLLGSNATESAFKNADLSWYGVIHLAVHGFAKNTYPDRAALAFLSECAQQGTMGFCRVPRSLSSSSMRIWLCCRLAIPRSDRLKDRRVSPRYPWLSCWPARKTWSPRSRPSMTPSRYTSLSSSISTLPQGSYLLLLLAQQSGTSCGSLAPRRCPTTGLDLRSRAYLIARWSRFPKDRNTEMSLTQENRSRILKSTKKLVLTPHKQRRRGLRRMGEARRRTGAGVAYRREGCF